MPYTLTHKPSRRVTFPQTPSPSISAITETRLKTQNKPVGATLRTICYNTMTAYLEILSGARSPQHVRSQLQPALYRKVVQESQRFHKAFSHPKKIQRLYILHDARNLVFCHGLVAISTQKLVITGYGQIHNNKDNIIWSDIRILRPISAD